MLKTLDLENCFVHKKLHIDFQLGHTLITGPNWTGKSLILEMVQYALWGSVALRGKADGYKGLVAQLTFDVKDVEYTVERRGSTTRLSKGQTPLASGTKAVNAAIRDLFGYGYEVFTMANAINQGKIEELGNMLPTARKKLVDQTIGLDRMDGLGEWIADQAKTLRAEIAASEKYLTAPVEPAPHPVQETAAELLKRLNFLQNSLTLQGTWKAQADVVLVKPEAVEVHPRLQELSALKVTQGTRQALIAQQRAISQALAGFSPLGEAPSGHPAQGQRAELVTITAAFKADSTQLGQVLDMLAKLPEPKYTLEQVTKTEADAEMAKRWAKKQSLLNELAEYVCPACDHHWHDEDPRLKDYADVPEVCPVVDIPAAKLVEAKKALATAEARQGLVEAQATLQERLKNLQDWTETIKDIDAAQREIELHQERLQQESRRLALVAQLEAIVLPEDQSALITELETNHKALEQLEHAMKAYTEKFEAKRHAMEQYHSFPADLKEQAELVRVQWQSRGIYESEVATYLAAKTKYDALLAEVEVSRGTLRQWVLCAQAVTTLRQRVKGYLLPSLNKVASGLLQTMTAGGLSWLVVSEDFDITVDGQALETLSGAGKSVANLALRIGLGQVLTNRTFSVLMPDEIDAACDDVRAEAIADSLKRLTGQIKQIIQVSHKRDLVADNYIRTGV